MIDIFRYCKYRIKTAFVRIIAEKLPKEKARKRKKYSFKKTEQNNRGCTILCRMDCSDHIFRNRILWRGNFTFVQKSLAS